MTQMCECSSPNCSEVVETTIEQLLEIRTSPEFDLIAKTCTHGPDPDQELVDEGDTFFVYGPKKPEMLLQCDRHSGPQLAYMVCVHILDGAVVSVYVEPQIHEAGEILCAACREHPAIDDVKMICKPCALEVCAGRLPA